MFTKYVCGTGIHKETGKLKAQKLNWYTKMLSLYELWLL